MKKATHKIIALLALFVLAGCNEKIVYHSFKTLKDEMFTHNDTLSFPINIQDSTSTLAVYLEIYNHNYYPYQNISLSISNNLNDSTQVDREIVYYELRNKDGDFTGKKINNLYLTEKHLTTILQPEIGEHTFVITSNMKDHELPGINNVGIKVIKK